MSETCVGAMSVGGTSRSSCTCENAYGAVGGYLTNAVIPRVGDVQVAKTIGSNSAGMIQTLSRQSLGRTCGVGGQNAWQRRHSTVGSDSSYVGLELIHHVHNPRAIHSYADRRVKPRGIPYAVSV